jgi:4-amino-4-deoxy-L-arabinose transferase-like glycosyltransferase
MRIAPVVLATLCVAVLFLGLDRVGFLDSREARDAQVAREMLARHEVLTPVYGRAALFEKPVLAYVPEMLARRLAPDSPLRSRQVRAVIALFLLVGTASLGARHFGLRAAWFSAAVLVTTLGLPLAARTDGTQLLGTLLGWVGAAGLADVVFGRSAGRDARLIVTYGALGAALASVGPLAALWPLGGLALFTALARSRETWRRARPLAGLAIMAGVALPWYGAMIERHGAGFLARAACFPYGGGAAGPWYAGAMLAVSFLVVGFLPWSALLPEALLHAATWWRAVRRPAPLGPRVAEDRPAPDPVSREQREEAAAHYLVACMLAALVPVAIIPGPPLSAALPALPAAALLCGRFLDHLFEDPGRVARPLTRAVRMLALIGTAAAVLLALGAPGVRGAAPQLRLLAALLLVTSWAPLLADLIGRRRVAAALMALPIALVCPVVSLRVLPAMENTLSARSVAEALDAVAPPLAPLVLTETPPPTLRLYGDHLLVVADSLATSWRKLRAADGMTYLAFRPAREHDVANAADTPLEILLRTPSLILARVQTE